MRFLNHPEDGRKCLDAPARRLEIARLPKCLRCGSQLLGAPCSVCGAGYALPAGPVPLTPEERIPLSCEGHGGMCCTCAERR